MKTRTLAARAMLVVCALFAARAQRAQAEDGSAAAAPPKAAPPPAAPPPAPVAPPPALVAPPPAFVAPPPAAPANGHAAPPPAAPGGAKAGAPAARPGHHGAKAAAAPVKPAPGAPKVAPPPANEDYVCPDDSFRAGGLCKDPNLKPAGTPPPDFLPGLNPCYRNAPTFTRRHAPNQAERIEAQRWLAYYPVCESYLNAHISDYDAEVHAAAAAGKDASDAATNLGRYKLALWSAQIDRHEAYDVIHDQLHDELDSRLWNQQLILAGSLLGGAGGAGLAELDLRWEFRLHDWAAKRYGEPVGFKYALSLGVAGGKNLTSEDVGILNLREDVVRLSVPGFATLSWAWVKSFIFASVGGAWVKHASPSLLGQVGVGFLQNWLEGGFVSDVRFVVEGWKPWTDGPFSMLFGFQLGLGVGCGRLKLDVPHDDRGAPH
jgi:hypothetical protein